MIIGTSRFYLTQGFKMSKECVIVGIVLIFMGGFSCGIFTPQPVEKPAGETLSDPFRVYSILENTGEQFSKTSYEDIFDTNFAFIAWDNSNYNRERTIEKLKTLNATCACEKISAVWDTCGNIGEIREGTSMTLCRTFYVTYFRSSGNKSDTGKAEFTLNRSSGNIWTIVEWKEEISRSIFHP
jgi:hypothetical protein